MTGGDYIYHGDRWEAYRIFESVCCTPKTNRTLGVKDIVLRKKRKLWEGTFHTDTLLLQRFEGVPGSELLLGLLGPLRIP